MHLKCYQCTSCGINPVFTGLSPTYGQVTYALLTRAPVSAPKGISLDLHVLGLSLAFILSQDQTLRCILFILHFPEGRMVRSMSPGNQVLTVKLSYSTFLVLLVFLFGLTLSKIVAPPGTVALSPRFLVSGCKDRGTFLSYQIFLLFF